MRHLSKWSDEELLRELIERNKTDRLQDRGSGIEIKFPDGEERKMIADASEFTVAVGRDDTVTMFICNDTCVALQEETWTGGHYASRKSRYIE